LGLIGNAIAVPILIKIPVLAANTDAYNHSRSDKRVNVCHALMHWTSINRIIEVISDILSSLIGFLESNTNILSPESSLIEEAVF
jgi:hypothetical protein